MNKAGISIQIVSQGSGKDDGGREGWGQGGGSAGDSDCGSEEFELGRAGNTCRIACGSLQTWAASVMVLVLTG